MGEDPPSHRADPEKLREYELYDRCVDVVSAFHWFFTGTKEMPSVVAHFERYPTVEVTVDGEVRAVTPDFTVLFKDGTGLVAEIANIALAEKSVEGLCKQLHHYSQLQALPGPEGKPVPVSAVDVMFLSPIKTGADAARRVFSERLDNAEHWYKPTERPVLIQFAQQSSEYVFQPWPDPKLNGNLRPHGSSTLTAMEFNQLTIRPEFFADNKVQFAFCNDPIPALYLATRLVVSVFPTLQREWGKVLETTTVDLVAALRRQYGHGKTADVVRAMELLKVAGLVSSKDGNSWRVLRGSVSLSREDIHISIATRVAKPLRRSQSLSRNRCSDRRLYSTTPNS
ncbi:hypothetical protein [Microbacterium pumilum]|uniref:Uncharacterized protein n=1 Tax=Microbacterium pumilum TaxID=344165 RepID=A0ABP5DHZ0_9MICO